MIAAGVDGGQKLCSDMNPASEDWSTGIPFARGLPQGIDDDSGLYLVGNSPSKRKQPSQKAACTDLSQITVVLSYA